MGRPSEWKAKGLCATCHINPREFTPRTKNPATRCNSCMAAAVRRYRATPAGILSARNVDIRRYHGKEGFDIVQNLIIKQDNKCAICGLTASESHKSTKRPNLYIDHDHTSGKIRGLLCNNCNSGVGKLKDSPEMLRKAADYLEKNG